MTNLHKLAILAAAALVMICLTVCAFTLCGPAAGSALALVSAVGMSFLMKDANLKVTKALPAGALTITSSGIDLMSGSRGDFLADVEWLLTAPALAVGQLADASTVTYSIEHDTDSAFGTVATLYASILVQTGAGGVGAAAATARFRLPTTVSRYIRFKAVKTGAADASASSATLEAQL